MKTREFQTLLVGLDALTAVQRETLLAALKSDDSSGEVVATLEAEFDKAPACGQCGSQAFARWGSASGFSGI